MNRRSFSLCCFLLCSMYAASASAGGGRLAAARSEADGDSNSASSSSRERSSNRSEPRRRPSRADDTPSLLGALFARPRHHHHHRDHDHHQCDHHHCDHAHHHHHHHHDEYEAPEYEVIEPPPSLYATYPYASPLGAYVLDAELLVASADPSGRLDVRLRADHAKAQPWGGQLMLDAGFLHGVAHSTFDARVHPPGRIELAARNAFLYEPSVHDYSILGAFDVGVRALQAHWLMVHLFAGVVWFGHAPDLLGGAEVGLRFDAFLGRPWVLSGRVAGGFADEAVIPSARIQLGYLFGRVELFAGYEYLQIGSIDLSTPFLGTRLWL